MHLKGLTHLSILSLGATHVTDAGCAIASDGVDETLGTLPRRHAGHRRWNKRAKARIAEPEDLPFSRVPIYPGIFLVASPSVGPQSIVCGGNQRVLRQRLDGSRAIAPGAETVTNEHTEAINTPEEVERAIGPFEV